MGERGFGGMKCEWAYKWKSYVFKRWRPLVLDNEVWDVRTHWLLWSVPKHDGTHMNSIEASEERGIDTMRSHHTGTILADY